MLGYAPGSCPTPLLHTDTNFVNLNTRRYISHKVPDVELLLIQHEKRLKQEQLFHKYPWVKQPATVRSQMKSLTV